MSLFTAQNKVLVIYLHYGSNFENSALIDQSVNTEIVQHCVLYKCDVSDSQMRQQLIATLKQSKELNAPIVPFPLPFGLTNLSQNSSMSFAKRICNLIDRPFLSPAEFPRLYIIIRLPFLESAPVPVGFPIDGLSACSSLPRDHTFYDLPLASVNTTTVGTLASPAASTSSSAFPASAATGSAASNVVGWRQHTNGGSSVVYLSFRYCLHEMAASTLTAVQLVSKLRSAYNNYKSMYSYYYTKNKSSMSFKSKFKYSTGMDASY